MEQLILNRERLEHTENGTKCIVRVSPETYNTLVDIANLTGMSISKTASRLIAFAAENTVVKEEE